MVAEGWLGGGRQSSRVSLPTVATVLAGVNWNSESRTAGGGREESFEISRYVHILGVYTIIIIIGKSLPEEASFREQRVKKSSHAGNRTPATAVDPNH